MLAPSICLGGAFLVSINKKEDYHARKTETKKIRRKVPLTIRPLVLLAAWLSTILAPTLLRDMELNHDVWEYEALVERTKCANTT